jgi:hypothetical protein
LKPALVLLAAGVGSRYGGLKQIEGFGPHGETIMEYSIFDALRAGFGKVVFVIRAEVESVFRESIGSKIGKRIETQYVHQRIDALPGGFAVPEGRTKPWGTGQALLAASEVVSEPFVAANADDFYGASAYAAIGDFLVKNAAAAPPPFAMVGYRLRDTMSEQGTVSRGVCACDADGWLKSITETHKIEKHGNDGRAPEAGGGMRMIPGDTRVSMNFWGFQPVFFDVLRDGFERFLTASAGSQTAEYYLPTAVQEAMAERGALVKVLTSDDAWCGVTHRHDKSAVESMLRGLVGNGVYPEALWS